MKKYITPEISLMLLVSDDILNQSDVLIDGSDLFGEEK